MRALAAEELSAVVDSAKGVLTRARPAPKLGAEYLTYRVGSEEYALNVLSVQEIRTYEKPTRIANAPSHVLGIVNLRGDIVPVYDLRLLMGCEAEYLATTVVVILRVDKRVVGVVVDAVCDVFLLTSEALREAPTVGTAADDIVAGIAVWNSEGSDRTVFLVDVNRLLELT